MKYILHIMFYSIAMADTPGWIDEPGKYQFTSTLVAGIVSYNGENIADYGDVLAAFDSEGNVRGVASILTPPFGPYAGQIVYEMTIRSNHDNEILSFQYYDAGENCSCIYDIAYSYEFTINDQLGHLIDGGENLIIDIDSAVCDIINCTETLSINKLLPQQFILESNYPNPYNPQTVIRYSVAQIADVTLEIFDIRGNLIAELISKIHSPGQYSILWNASSVAAGLYFVEMKAYSNNTQLIFKEINKMLFLK